MEIKFYGYDGSGQASYFFNYEDFVNDYKDEFDLHDFTSQVMFPNEWDEYIDFELDATSDLTNGDVINVRWDINKKKLEDKYECRIEFSDFSVIVEDLDPVTKYNPFDELVIQYNGIAPCLSAYVDMSEMEYDFLEFEIDKTSRLNNGDVIKVTVVQDEEFINNCKDYGVELTSFEKEYTLSGFDSYVTTIASIPADGMTSMQKQAEDTFNARVARSWDEEVSVTGINYLGSYLINKKTNIEYTDYDNRLFLVYKIDVDDGKENFSYYYYVRYTDLIILADGTFSVDLSNYVVPEGGNFFGLYGEAFERGGRTYLGYETIESLFSKCVTKNIEEYTYESTVEE